MGKAWEQIGPLLPENRRSRLRLVSSTRPRRADEQRPNRTPKHSWNMWAWILAGKATQ
jgi:hypothetical protein